MAAIDLRVTFTHFLSTFVLDFSKPIDFFPWSLRLIRQKPLLTVVALYISMRGQLRIKISEVNFWFMIHRDTIVEVKRHDSHTHCVFLNGTTYIMHNSKWNFKIPTGLVIVESDWNYCSTCTFQRIFIFRNSRWL